MSANSTCLIQRSGTSSGVRGNWLADDETIFGEFSDGLARVGLRDFLGFVGIEPNLTLSAVKNRRRQALLGAEVDPVQRHIG
jgi:hypothetical protein